VCSTLICKEVDVTPWDIHPVAELCRYWEYRLKPWDVTGGIIVLTEAGGKATTMDGRPYRCVWTAVRGWVGVV
jgi:hypothetical protein